MKDRFKIEDAIQVQLGFEPPLDWIEDDEETEETAQEIEAEESTTRKNDDDGRGDWRQFRQKE